MTILESLAFLKQQQWIDLTHEVTPRIPYFPSFQPMKEKTLFTVDQDGFYAKEYTLVTQYGTHLDAPIHFSNGKKALEELTVKELFLPLLVLHKEVQVKDNPDYVVELADILTFEEEYGLIPPNSFVAFSSGWSKRWHNPESFYNIDDQGCPHTPGWSLEALTFLHEKRNVAGIGHETLDTDSGLDCQKHQDLIAERYWLSKNKFQVEVLTQLEKLPATGGVISINVPKIKQSPGFTARVYAIVPNVLE